MILADFRLSCRPRLLPSSVLLNLPQGPRLRLSRHVDIRPATPAEPQDDILDWDLRFRLYRIDRLATTSVRQSQSPLSPRGDDLSRKAEPLLIGPERGKRSVLEEGFEEFKGERGESGEEFRIGSQGRLGRSPYEFLRVTVGQVVFSIQQ
jgi:hypothetical protein